MILAILTAFFAGLFGYALWRTRPRNDPELDRVYAELALEPSPSPSASRELTGFRSVARMYLVLGALVTALGLFASFQQIEELGNAEVTLYAMVAIVVGWAAAVPFVLRRSREATVAVLRPLGLAQDGPRISGERHGRDVSIELTARGSVTRIATDGEPIVIRRRGHDGAAWLVDLREAELLADERER